VNLGISYRRLRRDETGATALEYCLIAALIGLAIIAGATAFGTSINAGYSDIAGSIPAS
jgi:pilus assembly protein Flp/PilA